MTCIVIVNQKVCRAGISCHRNGTFTYHDGKDWVQGAKTVPRAIIDAPLTLESDRYRVLDRLDELKRDPS